MPHNAPNDYDFDRSIQAIRRFWWLVLLPPLVVLIGLTIWNLNADYQSTVRASILLPGDTEIPGSAERPELMILDDLGPVVRSEAFATLVAERAGLNPSDVIGTLDAERYSRIATIIASNSDAERARQIAAAAEAVLPDAVNLFMVSEGGQPATVVIIDPASEATRGEDNKWAVTAIATLVALAIGIFAALVLDALKPVRRAEPPVAGPQ